MDKDFLKGAGFALVGLVGFKALGGNGFKSLSNPSKPPSNWHKDWHKYAGAQGKRKLFMEIYRSATNKTIGDISHGTVTHAMKKLDKTKPKGRQVAKVVNDIVERYYKKNNPIGHDPTEWLQQNFPGKAKYSITYEVWDEESLEIGDTDEKGFYEKDVKIKDFDDLVAVVDEMRNLENGHWSQGPKVSAKDLSKGHVWYEGLYNEDIKTGDREYHSYHFKNLSDDEALYILTGLE